MAPIKLPRLPLNWKDQPQLFERYWNEAMTNIEKSLNQLLALPEIQAAIDAAQLTADVANTAAINAQSSADASTAITRAMAKENSLVNSYITSAPGSFITANSSGVVTVPNHTRIYGDSVLNPTVAVDGDSFPTFAGAGDLVRVYYSDPTRAGGVVSYLFTIDPATPQSQTGDFHSVGAIVIPSTGVSAGNNLHPPGYIYL